MKASEIDYGTYEGKNGTRREVVDIWLSAGLIDWRKPGESDGPRTTLAAFARWAARKIN